MDNTRLTAIGQQLYRRPTGWTDWLAADLAVAPRTVRSWIAAPGTVGHRNIPAQTAALLERAHAEADRLKLWERPDCNPKGLLIQRL